MPRFLPERVFGKISLRHILPMVLVLIPTSLVMWSLELEGRAVEQLLPPLLQARADLLKVSAISFFLAVIGTIGILTSWKRRSLDRDSERSRILAHDLLESIPTGVVAVDREGRVAFLNLAAAQLMGQTPQGIVGRSYQEVVHPPELQELLRRGLSERARPPQIDLELTPPGRRETCFLRAGLSFLEDLSGHPIGLVLWLRDYSQVVHLERQLRHADKMAALGTLAAGLAHEIKNPLSALDLNLHLLEEELKGSGNLSPTTQPYLQILQAEMRRLNAILEDFCKLARPSDLKLDPLQLNGIVSGVIDLILHEAREKRVEVKTDLFPDLPTLHGDETQLGQVFLNIMINAIQAMPNGGNLTVATGRVDGRQGFIEARFTDTGVGIPPEHLGRIFDPYFTTRENGMGLGLAIAYRIAKDHGGGIDVESTVGHGTTVRVRLPVRHVLTEDR